MPLVPPVSRLVLLASMTLATAVAAQQPAPPPGAKQPAPPPEVQLPAPPPETKQPAPPVVAAEQVAPAELTGLLGHAVVGAKDAELGRIVDLLVDGQGRVRAVVIDVGGFMGVGSRKVAVAWAALRFAEQKQGPVISIAIPPDRIKSWADYIAGRPVAILGVPSSGQ
jgi:PRC-barrel domain